MKARSLPIWLATAFLSCAASADQTLIENGNITGGTVITERSVNVQNLGNAVRVRMNDRFAAYGVNLGGADWSAYTHVLFTVTNNNSTPSVLEIVLDSGTSGWAWTDTLVGPNSSVQIAIPLATNGRTQFPIPIDGITQTQTSGSVVKSSMRKIRIWNIQKTGAQDVTLEDLRAVTFAPRTSSIIDQYGQQTVNFASKVAASGDLSSDAASEAITYNGQYPFNADNYGALAGSATSQGTGRWRTQKQNGRWYIIAPNGNRFFSSGVNCVGIGSYAYITGREALFAPGSLPSQGGSFAEHYGTYTSPFNGQPETGFNFYTANLERKYGVNWMTASRTAILNKMRSWGFNTVGSGSRADFAQPGVGITSTEHVSISGNTAMLPSPGAYFSMPDPFDSRFAATVQQCLAPVVNRVAGNLNHLGIFVDNEMPWASSGNNVARYNLAFDVLSAPSNQPAKASFIRTLTLKYRTIQKLNTAWGTNYASWTAMQNNTNYRPTTVRSAAAVDLSTFIQQYANLYFSTIRSKLVALNYRGLYLGCRFANYCPEALTAAKRYCDVVSFNAYDTQPGLWRPELKALDAPVLIGEYGFAASDMGRAGAAYPCAMTESDRVLGFTSYISEASTWPNLVGMHWYKWQDEPCVGRMWDGSNETLGLESITDRPYAPLVAAATQANTGLINRMITP